MSKLYYSFGLYIMNNVVLTVWLVLYVLSLFSLLFEVMTFTNGKRQVEVSPKGTRIFGKILALTTAVGLAVLLLWLYIPILFETPKIMSGESLGISGEVLSGYRNEIFIFWAVCLVISVLIIGRSLLLSLTKRIKKSKKRTQIFIWGREYSICLLIQAFVTAMCLLILIGSWTGTYSEQIQTFWNCIIWIELGMTLINGVLIHQKIIIYNNDLLVYAKYGKQGFGTKEDMEIMDDGANKVKIRIKKDITFSVGCSPMGKEELLAYFGADNSIRESEKNNLLQ